MRPKPRLRTLGDLASENGADAALGILFAWPETNRFIALETLGVIYNFELSTLEMAARSLERSGKIVRQERLVRPRRKGKYGWRRFLCSRYVVFCKRVSTP